MPPGMKLSNTQSKNAEAWHIAIMAEIRTTIKSSSNTSLEALLKKYQDQEPDQLKAAINAHKDKQTALALACDLCVTPLQPEHESTMLPILKKNVLLLLEYGADPNLCTPHPFEILFFDIKLFNLPANYEFKFADLVNQMIDLGADLSLRHQNEMTIAHLAAGLDRKRTVLTKVLNKQPQEIE